MKKIISLLISIMIIISVAAPAFASGTPMVVVSTASGTPGSTVEVNVSLQNNPGIVSMTLNVSYNENVMTLTSVRDTGLLSGGMHTTKYKSPYVLTWANDTSRTNFYVNGSTATLVFTINSQAAAGTYPIEVSTPIHGIYNYDIKEVPFQMISGGVTVTGAGSPSTPDNPGNPNTPSNPSNPNNPNIPSNPDTPIIPNDPVIPLPPGHVHTMTLVNEIAATCAAEGIMRHWKCTQCNRMYLDEQGITEIASAYTPRNMQNHIGTTYVKDSVAPTAETVGYTGDTYCLGCNILIALGTVIPKGGATVDIPQSGVSDYGAQLKASIKLIDNNTAWTNPFGDVKTNDPYYLAVRFVNRNNLFKGVADDKFAPERTMTRGMFVTVLGRLANVPDNPNTPSGFTDVPTGQWYSAFVGWAAEHNIINGYLNGSFGINDEITFEQAVTIMARFAKLIGVYKESSKPLTAYADAGKVSNWAYKEMQWAAENGVYTGSYGVLNPQGTTSRAHVAAMIYNFCRIYGLTV